MSYDKIPDVRDGLTRQERIVLTVLHQAQKERGGRNVPTAMLWGRVCEQPTHSGSGRSGKGARWKRDDMKIAAWIRTGTWAWARPMSSPA